MLVQSGRPPTERGVAQSGSAPHWGCGGRWFKSSRPDQSTPIRCAAATLLALMLSAIAGVGQAQERAPCGDYRTERQLFFGDTHIHTAYSLDAAIQGARNKPADAYRFARGEKIGLQPYDREGRPLRELQLRRPLDFAAVTDHAEALGEATICRSPGAAGYHHWQCYLLRWMPKVALMVLMGQISAQDGENLSLCGKGKERCLQQAARSWDDIVSAAYAAYDRSSECRFSTFIGYEWTASREADNLHRNVLFRNDNLGSLPQPPPSSLQLRNPADLIEALDRECYQQPGCDVISIPHNSNLSSGQMFPLGDGSAKPGTERLVWDPEAASRRARIEPLLEVMQHKGDSECWYGPGVEDELCAFEKLPFDNFAGSFYRKLAKLPTPMTGFARRVLLAGLQYEDEIGVNPWRLGLIAATDTHLGVPGAVSEEDYMGHGGAGKPATASSEPRLPDTLEYNPGGLAGVWAEENSRDSLFNAMRRREVFGTSGPRISLRFFGGWNYSQSLCNSSNVARRAYAGGTPMGGTMDPKPAWNRGGPEFVALAVRDAGTEGRPGALLQRLQIVKGWLDAGGELRQRVYDVAGSLDNGASVERSSCRRYGDGHDRLCTVWSDPDYSEGQRAFYYARAVENPSCRWSAYVCNANGVDCSRPDTVDEAFEACCASNHRWRIQERAWSSPIWLGPEAQAHRR